jgi:hypothetical protein
MIRELNYFILWFFFGLIFALALSLHLDFPFLPKKKYEQDFFNYLSRFLIFFIPYLYFWLVRLLLVSIHKLRIIKENKSPSVIASILFFTIFLGYFANVYANNVVYSTLIKHPTIYEAITPINNDYKLVTWKRYDHFSDFVFYEDVGYVDETILLEEILSFNSDTTGWLVRNLFIKDNLLIWKYIFQSYDNTYKDSVLAKDDTIFFLIDYRKLFFENNQLRFESRPFVFFN